MEKKHGHGTEITEKGMYEGNWIDDNKEGHGTYYLNDGRNCEGEWRNDKPYSVKWKGIKLMNIINFLS